METDAALASAATPPTDKGDVELAADGRQSRPAPSARAPRRHHLQMLLIAVFVVGAAALLQVREDERVALAASSQIKLPPTCASRMLFNVDCPGCGLTRSFVHLAHGNWQASWRVHRVGWLLAAIAVLQIPLRLWVLWRWPKPVYPQVWGGRMVWGVVVLLIVNWLVKMTVG